MANNSQTFTETETCNKVFDLREQLREHSIKEHESKEGDSIKEQLTFASCNTTFTSQEDLKQHSIKEHEGRQ